MLISRKTIFQISKQELEEILSNYLVEQGEEFNNLKFEYLYNYSGNPAETCPNFFGVEIISEYEE